MSDTDSLSRMDEALARDGYARLPGAQMLARLGIGEADWRGFARTWDDLGPDLYMADGGRYRRRRHATFALRAGHYVRQPHQPHYQSRDYNPLNGDVQRWFDPVDQATVAMPACQAILGWCADSFDPAAKGDWLVELHQFRIEARPGETGRPTPEGMHRDGVDRVMVMLVERRNVREGVTRIGAPDGAPLGEFTLTDPADTMLIDDHRILHGVTEIHPLDPAQPAWRDALVVTFAPKG
ncbi:MAG TPA: hypothetical protein DCG90_03265 [Sphingobium sp.]|uniref:2OG-Fe dioxygenase family protein n=1 Tax=Sphingobium sp. TaxID=1912891 RepID=UPI000ED06F05|nr:2OG-Fe dioxygenase family protein [Sphingobium sp.]HAF40773.1 hypothetical protein [Sphingobium sp.]